MKKILYIFLAIYMALVSSHAATRGDVKVIEASENIRYLTQKIIKSYLHLYRNPKKKSIKHDISESLNRLSDSFRDIAITTKDSDSKDMLDYLMFSKDEIEGIANKKANDEQALLMLDYSEALLEGVRSIEDAHKYDFSQEEKMLIATQKMTYLLERIIKHYMAFKMNLNVKINKKQMKIAIINFEDNLQKINAYDYPHDVDDIRAKINKFWKVNRDFFTKADKLFIPNLLSDSMVYLEGTIAQIALYHSKNQ